MTIPRRLEDIRTEWLTPERVADLLDIDVSTVYRWLNSGTLAGLQLGKKWKITEADVAAFIEAERQRQQIKIQYRQAMRQARKEQKQAQLGDPDTIWDIVPCSNCGTPMVADAESTSDPICLVQCGDLRRQLEELQSAQPETAWVIGPCANCGTAAVMDASQRDQSVCSMHCAEAMQPF